VVAGPAGRDPHKRAAAALAAEVARVAVARSEQRNTTLFQAAANLFEIVNTGYLDEGQVRAELTAAGVAVGLGEREIAQTLDAQWRRKEGVRRAGWEPGGGAGSDHLRLRRAQMMVGPPVWGGSRGGGFGR
jgi:hypothetical protein